MVGTAGFEPATTTPPVLYNSLSKLLNQKEIILKQLINKGFYLTFLAYALFQNVTHVIIHVAPVLTGIINQESLVRYIGIEKNTHHNLNATLHAG
mgnify:CR=1 FL=1